MQPRLSWHRRADFTGLQGRARILRCEREIALATTQGLVMKPSNLALQIEPPELAAVAPPETVPRLVLELLKEREPQAARRRRGSAGHRAIVIRDHGLSAFRVF
jgi:hypothetical protein